MLFIVIVKFVLSLYHLKYYNQRYMMMKVNNIRDNNECPGFGILKLKNNILKYEKPIELVKNSKDMQTLVDKFEHKGIDVSVEFSDAEYSTFLPSNDPFTQRIRSSHTGTQVNISFINKLGKFIDKVSDNIIIHKDADFLSFDTKKFVENFENNHVYH